MLAADSRQAEYIVSSLDTPLSWPTYQPTPGRHLLVALPTPDPEVQPVVRLQIPRLHIDRAVIPLDLRSNAQGIIEWDAEALFATRNRPDLVGHVPGSALPGTGGNVVLTGHNYNRGRYNWRGVFVDLKKLRADDEVIVTTADGRQSSYRVQSVNEVTLRGRNPTEQERHAALLGPYDHERLTLVTCGGANIWPFPTRVYVVALPAPPTP